MNTNQIAATQKTDMPFLAGLSETNGLKLNPNYNGSLSAKDLKQIQKDFPQYQNLEKQTGVPWKIVAAMDLAVPDLLRSAKTMAHDIQTVSASTNTKIPADINESDAAKLVTLAKEQNPSAGKYLDNAYRYFCEINRAFSN